MYSILEIDGKKFEIAANALTKHFYKQVFKTDLRRDLMKNNPAALLKRAEELRDIAKKLEAGEVENYEETLETTIQLEELQDTTARLGFIMNTQATKQFSEYWGRTTFDHYAAWLVERGEDFLQSPEFMAGVMNCWTSNTRQESTEKNQHGPL